jgi:hypothetical protein
VGKRDWRFAVSEKLGLAIQKMQFIINISLIVNLCLNLVFNNILQLLSDIQTRIQDFKKGTTTEFDWFKSGDVQLGLNGRIYDFLKINSLDDAFLVCLEVENLKTR